MTWFPLKFVEIYFKWSKVISVFVYVSHGLTESMDCLIARCKVLCISVLCIYFHSVYCLFIWDVISMRGKDCVLFSAPSPLARIVTDI